jgi:hypothetical protein
LISHVVSDLAYGGVKDSHQCVPSLFSGSCRLGITRKERGAYGSIELRMVDSSDGDAQRCFQSAEHPGVFGHTTGHGDFRFGYYASDHGCRPVGQSAVQTGDDIGNISAFIN